MPSSTEPTDQALEQDNVIEIREDGTSSNPLTTTDPPSKKTVTKKIIKKKRRPARPQVDASTLTSEPPPQTGTIFNIWYNKWSGGDHDDKYLSNDPAPGRCNIARDSGYTRADKVRGAFFCLYFASGVCPKGHECDYLHRLPTLHDLYNPNVDCFGRDKSSDYRDDMDGVGSFMRQNRTLYVGRIHVTDDIEEVVARHFQEWGQIDRIRVLTGRGVAFVTYTNEANSQFAKMAMSRQSLDHNEIINVRWATADPNPLAQKREAQAIEEQAAEAVRRALPAEFVAELEGRDPEAKKRKRIESSLGLQGYEAPDDVWYARGSNAVNPVGRQGIEDAPATAMIEEAPQVQTTVEDNSIFSSSTITALKGISAQSGQGSARIGTAKSASSGGPLVAYGSDDDSD